MLREPIPTSRAKPILPVLCTARLRIVSDLTPRWSAEQGCLTGGRPIRGILMAQSPTYLQAARAYPAPPAPDTAAALVRGNGPEAARSAVQAVETWWKHGDATASRLIDRLRPNRVSPLSTLAKPGYSVVYVRRLPRRATREPRARRDSVAGSGMASMVRLPGTDGVL